MMVMAATVEISFGVVDDEADAGVTMNMDVTQDLP